MKRLYCVLLAALLMVSVTACGCNDNKNPAPDEDPVYTAPESLTYTDFPTQLTAEKWGSIDREVVIAAGGLYYKDGENYGIMTLDGQVDSGAVYVHCEPKGRYFVVAKQESDDQDVMTANTVGLVDATGKEIIPLQYASIELLGDGDRFARVAELTGTTENSEEKLTQTVVDGKAVMCTGNWYIYDLQTGACVPNATGTKPYIIFDCGGYVKYVKDDKTPVVATPDGNALPEEPIHLKNGYYAISSENTVYDSNGNKKFTYDPNGYIPVNSEDVSGYTIAEKQEGSKKTYVLLDASGQIASAVFAHKPVQYGELYHVGDSLVKIDGTPVVKEGCQRVFWESAYGQCWAVNDGKTTKVVDKTGNVLFENKVGESLVDTQTMLCYSVEGTPRVYYSMKSKGFTIKGIGLAPFIVKRPLDEGGYMLVNVLTDEAILSGALDYKVRMDGSVLYVYAKTGDAAVDVYVVR